MKHAPILALLPLLATLIGCTPKVQIDIGGGMERELAPAVVIRDDDAGADRIAMIDVRGLIMDAASPSLIGTGINPVDRFVAQLQMAEKDPTIKAIVLRITSPGGTVTASDMMHQELRRFAKLTHKPVVASLGEVAASGGYYLAVGADYIVTEPTCITGSIGVIMPTINFSEGLNKIGIHARSVKSGANKDIANPLEPMRDSQYAVLQGLVDEYYARFRGLVVERRKINPADINDCTDGRVVSGVKAVELGLADEVGGVREAFAAAKKLAGIKSASLVKYSNKDRPARTMYALAENTPAAKSDRGVTLHMDLGSITNELAPGETSGIFYLWMPSMQ